MYAGMSLAAASFSCRISLNTAGKPMESVIHATEDTQRIWQHEQSRADQGGQAIMWCTEWRSAKGHFTKEKAGRAGGAWQSREGRSRSYMVHRVVFCNRASKNGRQGRAGQAGQGGQGSTAIADLLATVPSTAQWMPMRTRGPLNTFSPLSSFSCTPPQVTSAVSCSYNTSQPTSESRYKLAHGKRPEYGARMRYQQQQYLIKGANDTGEGLWGQGLWEQGPAQGMAGGESGGESGQREHRGKGAFAGGGIGGEGGGGERRRQEQRDEG